MIPELDDRQFEQTFGNRMDDMAEMDVENPINIWIQISELAEKGIIDKYVFENNLVEGAYRNDLKTFDHVLLPTQEENKFIVIVVDLINEIVFGYHHLDLNEKYGID